MKNTSSFFGVIIAIASVFFFSTYAIFGRLLLENFTSETLIALSSTLSVFIIFLLYGFFPELQELKKYSKKEITILFLISFLSAVVAPLFFLKGLESTTATNAMIIGKLEPVFVGIFCVFLLKETFNKFQIIGSVLMIIGVFYVATRGFSIGLSFKNIGDVFIIAGAFFGAVSTTIFKKYLHHIKPEIVVLLRNAVGSLFLLILFPFFFDFSHSTENILDKKILLLLFGFSLFTILLAQVLWYKALDMLEASRISTFSMLGPVFGIIMAVSILGEKIFSFHIIGFIFVLVGLVITLHHEKKHQHHEKYLRIKHFFHH